MDRSEMDKKLEESIVWLIISLSVGVAVARIGLRCWFSGREKESRPPSISSAFPDYVRRGSGWAPRRPSDIGE